MNRHRWSDGQPIERVVADKYTPLHTEVIQAIGQAASLHWPASKEIFKAEEALKISETLIKYIEEHR